MTHLSFIVAAYALAVAIPAGFAIEATRRLATVRRRLAIIDPRASR